LSLSAIVPEQQKPEAVVPRIANSNSHGTFSLATLPTRRKTGVFPIYYRSLQVDLSPLRAADSRTCMLNLDSVSRIGTCLLEIVWFTAIHYHHGEIDQMVILPYAAVSSPTYNHIGSKLGNVL